jgi:hypothetical protein
MSVRTRGRHVMLFTAVVVFATFGVGYAQVPKAEDIAACNAEAQRAVNAGTTSGASPLPKDHDRAAGARSAKGTGQVAGAGVKSDDPQLAGMDAEGAKDPAYQAAYRTCMRKAGF